MHPNGGNQRTAFGRICPYAATTITSGLKVTSFGIRIGGADFLGLEDVEIEFSRRDLHRRCTQPEIPACRAVRFSENRQHLM